MSSHVAYHVGYFGLFSHEKTLSGKLVETYLERQEEVGMQPWNIYDSTDRISF